MDSPLLNFVYDHLITTLWVCWLIYWKVAARGVKSVARWESLGSRIGHLGPLILAVTLLMWPNNGSNFLFQEIWPRTILVFWTGVALLVLGLGFTIWARLVLGRNWSATVTIKEDHSLVQEGPYRLVRHPIYTGLLLGFIGTAIAMAEWRGVVACALVAGGFIYKLKLEERWMTEIFGAAYGEYRQRVAGLIPFVW